MKTMCKLLFCGMGILLACTKATTLNEGPGYESASVTLPFSATFRGYNTSSGQNRAGCLTDFDHIVEIANGKGSYVGFSSFHSDFCSNTGSINPGLSYIMSQNGDTLFLTFWGKTCVGLGKKENEKNDHSNEICCWEIPFTILGGTGAFKGAMGGGTTDDYLSSEGNTYYHSWKGTITLSKEHLQEIQNN